MKKETSFLTYMWNILMNFLKCFLQSKPPEDYGDEKGPADLPSSVAQAPHLAIGVGMAPPQGN